LKKWLDKDRYPIKSSVQGPATGHDDGPSIPGGAHAAPATETTRLLDSNPYNTYVPQVGSGKKKESPTGKEEESSKGKEKAIEQGRKRGNGREKESKNLPEKGKKTDSSDDEEKCKTSASKKPLAASPSGPLEEKNLSKKEDSNASSLPVPSSMEGVSTAKDNGRNDRAPQKELDERKTETG